MKLHRNLVHFKAQNPILTIGTFDGVHLGHQKIIDRLIYLARSLNGESVIFTFDPHPRKVVAPGETNLRILTTLDEKIELFEKSGIDHLIIYPFTPEFARLSYEQFVEQVLVQQVHTKYLVVGYDHKFGKNRQGDFEFLQESATRFGFQIEKLDVLLLNESNVSSTKIREAIQKGDLETANAFLGYPFMIHGKVVEGQKLGRQIQFPTANLETTDPDKIIPGFGVYAVKVKVAEKWHTAMLNIGTRPTVNTNADNRSIEAHIFDFNSDIYGAELEVEFHCKLRDEQKFSSIEALKEQLKKDKAETLNYFNSVKS